MLICQPWFRWTCLAPESSPTVTLFLTLARLHSDSLPFVVSGGFWNGEGTEGISNSRIPLCAVCWFQSGDCNPDEYLPLTDVCVNSADSSVSPMTAVPVWIHARKSSHCFKRKMKLFFGLYFNFPDLVWNTKGSRSHFSISPSLKTRKLCVLWVLNNHNRFALSPCEGSENG